MVELIVPDEEIVAAMDALRKDSGVDPNGEPNATAVTPEEAFEVSAELEMEGPDDGE